MFILAVSLLPVDLRHRISRAPRTPGIQNHTYPIPHGYSRRLCLHLLAAVDQTLLRRRDAFLLLDALLYALDLYHLSMVSLLKTRFALLLASLAAYLVVGLDVQLDLFAGEGADSGWGRIGQLSCGFAFR